MGDAEGDDWEASTAGNIGAGVSSSGSESECERSSTGSDTRAAELEDDGDAGDGTALRQSVHYYVDVPHSEDSAYAACKGNVHIDTEFHNHLQEESGTADISTFLALLEIILARERRREQPLLDFTKSKILTSHVYTESCEHLLAQKEALQVEMKRKAEIWEATKETRRQEKEEKQVQIRARKEACTGKKLEKERSLLEKRATTTRRRLSAARTQESPPRSPGFLDGQRGPNLLHRMQAGLGASALWGEPHLTGPPPRPLSLRFLTLSYCKQHGRRIPCNPRPRFGSIPCSPCHTCSTTLSLSLPTTIILPGYPTSPWQVQATSRVDQPSKVCGYWVRIWQPLDLTSMVWERGRAPTVEGEIHFYDLVALVRKTRWAIQNSDRSGFCRSFARNAPTKCLVQLSTLCTC